MPSAEQLLRRLFKKLYELFQLDQPDLDFGFYRIMHAKAREVQDFIGTDLLKIAADAFGEPNEARKAKLQSEYDKAIQTAKEFGAPKPEESEPVKKAKAALDGFKNTAGAESDVYDHLYRFFERYYDDGDFISRRYYTRETSGKAAPFAVPYNGEEVKLHWANADQYYIKTAEYFSNFTFDLRPARDNHAQPHNQTDILPDVNNESPLKVHFRIVDATEGEHGNLKTSEANKRFFILHDDEPVALSESGELVVNFEYRSDPEKNGQESTWREKRNAEAVEAILEHLKVMAAAGGELAPQVAEYLRLLSAPAPTESDSKRPVLAKYINQYTARNTMDYFIHKDLGGFLRRELDFYIKNEVMHLDDIENAEAPAVEGYLAKIKVLRKIAGKLIDFLAQLEDFQKKLWLKKKFIVETNYCLTLDRVPEELYAEVAANEAQCEEWIKLFAIDDIQADLNNPGFSRPLTADFLRANNKLVLDTRFFDESFTARLVASIENFDEQCDGLLIHSENFQALNLLSTKYNSTLSGIYIDPPYNTDATEILYKNGYKDSSWCALIYDRILLAHNFLAPSAVACTTIDECEVSNLSFVLSQALPSCLLRPVIIEYNHRGRVKSNFAITHEYALWAIPQGKDLITRKRETSGDIRRNLRRTGTDSTRQASAKQFFGIEVNNRTFEIISVTGPLPLGAEIPIHHNPNTTVVWPIDDHGIERRWYYGSDRVIKEAKEGTVWAKKIKGELQIHYHQDGKAKMRKSVWVGKLLDSSTYGSELLNDLFGLGKSDFSFPKSINAVQDCIESITYSANAIFLDFFGGSGTTGHAVINLNREDDGRRKYIIVEMGNYFDTVLKSRLAKIVYSESWNNGKPAARHTGISHCFKYIRLESYEDTLNNLRFDNNPQLTKVMAANPALKEDYMLHYLLDVETRGSQSLLNIDAFNDPAAYTLEIKKPGTDECTTRTVDLLETFNYLLGLRVLHISVPQTFQAAFKQVTDPELPEDQQAKLVLDGGIREEAAGPWWFRKVEGWVPKDTANPNNGQRENILIVWRKLTGDIERDNLMLDEWFRKSRDSTKDFEFDAIYVNGSNNLPGLKPDGENWKVRLIEEEFMKRMWSGENA